MGNTMTGATRFGSEFLVNTTTESSQDSPTVTALAGGNFVVVWTDGSMTGGDTSGAAIRAQVFNADGSKMGNEFLVNTTTVSGQAAPTVATLSDGRFVVVWDDDSQSADDASGSALRAQIFTANGSKSGAEFLVDTATFSYQLGPKITALNNGGFVVTWTDGSFSGADLSSWAVNAQVFNANGSKSGAEFLVNTTTQNFQYNPEITALSNGHFVVVWTDGSTTGGDTSGSAVRAQVFNADGSKSGAEFLVNTTTAGDQSGPGGNPGTLAIAGLADGRFVVAWGEDGNDTPSTSTAIRAQIFNADGSKSGAEFLVNTATASFQLNPTITGFADGRFVVGWTDGTQSDGDASGTAIRAQVFNADGSKSGADFLVNTTTTSFQQYPTMAALANGHFVVTWDDFSQTGADASDTAVRAQIFDAGSPTALLFTGMNTSGVFGLWVTNGTAAGTHELTGISGANPGGINPLYSTPFNGKVVFSGKDTSGNIGLWVTDGTVAGTHELTGISGANSTSFLNVLNSPDFTALGDRILFEGKNASGSEGLWITDGTAAGTHEITGISGAFAGTYGGITGFHPADMTVFNGEVLFSASDASFGGGADQLWVTDGTAAGTHELIGISGAFSNFFPYDMLVFNGHVLLAGQDTSFHDGLWITDGTTAGTHEITNSINVAYHGENYSGFTPLNGKVLFDGADAGGKYGLCVTDGTAAGTFELNISGAYPLGLFHNTQPFFTVFNGKVLFSGFNANGDQGLWVTDGTAAGTHEITGISGVYTGGAAGGPFGPGLEPTNFTVFNGEVVFNGRNANGQFGLWVTDGTAGGTHEVTGINGAAGVNPSNWAPIVLASPSWTVAAASTPVSENAGSLTFTITRPDNSSAQTVLVSTIQDQGYHNAASGTTSTNYYYGGLANVAYTFSPGKSSIQVPVAIYDHGLTSGSEKFSFDVRSLSGSDLASTTFTILNNDTATTTYSISPSPAAANENQGALNFTLTRSNNSGAQVVDVSTVQDQGYYNAATGTISTNYYYDGLASVPYSFSPGQSSIPVSITLHDRGLTSGSEKFSLDIQSTSGSNLASTTFTIVNSDHAPATIQPSPTDIHPTINGSANFSAQVNDSLDFTSSIRANDPDGSVEFYLFQRVSGNGVFTLGGLDSGASVKVPASQLFRMGFHADPSPGVDQIQVQAIDNEGATSTPLNIVVNVSARTGSTPAPNYGILVDLSSDVYRTIPTGADGYSVVAYNTAGDRFDVQLDGFFSAAYASSDGSEVVIAIEGTDVRNFDNLYADGSWAVNAVDQTLRSYFEDAVRMLLNVEDAHPGATIQITGHSMGGALAQLLGEASNLKVTAFDAPGAQQFYQTLLNDLRSDDPTSYNRLTTEAALRLAQSDVNIRLYGDPVSTVGTAIGTRITLQNPSTNPADLAPLDNHNINWLDTQVKGFLAGLVQQIPDDADEPNNWGAILHVDQVLFGNVRGGIVTAAIEGFHQWWVDPSGASDFVYTQDKNSPNITSIDLPLLPGVQSYELRYETGNSWSAFEQVWPGQWHALEPNVRGVEFVPLDSSGNAIFVSDSVMFGLIFGATGTIKGTLNSSGQHFVFGGTGNDTLIGGLADDTIVGGPGNDTIDGGTGTNTAVYSGRHSDYLVTQLSANSVQISDTRAGSPDGSDTVSNVQNFQFADATYTFDTPVFPQPTFQLTGFAPNAGGWSSDHTYPRELADVNGDGMADIVGFGDAGVWVSLATGGGSFGNASLRTTGFAVGSGGWTSDDKFPRELADVNGDHMADIVGFGDAGAWVSLATGGGSFAAASLKTTGFAVGAGGWTSNDKFPRELADVNGDGMADIVGFGDAGVWVSLATGGGSFGDASLRTTGFAVGAGGWTSQDKFPRELADVNGDHMADIVGFGEAGVWVSLATGGGSFGPASLKTAGFAFGAGGWISDDKYPRELADVNGDGMADIVGFGEGGVWVAPATGGGSFGTASLELGNFAHSAGAGGWISADQFPRELADVNHDGKADIVGFGQLGVYEALSNGFHLV
jgi:ELWxxDGT repeat protein